MRSDLMMRAIGGLFHGLFFLGNEKKTNVKRDNGGLYFYFYWKLQLR